VFHRRAAKSTPKADAGTKAPRENETVTRAERLREQGHHKCHAQEARARDQAFPSFFRAIAWGIDLDGAFELGANAGIASKSLRHHRHRRRRFGDLSSGAPQDIGPEPFAPAMKRRVRGRFFPAKIAPHHVPQRARPERVARHRVADHPEAVPLARQHLTRKNPKTPPAAQTPPKSHDQEENDDLKNRNRPRWARGRDGDTCFSSAIAPLPNSEGSGRTRDRDALVRDPDCR
jgi:hypothetical protein